ncbi:MAG: hypothetical protein IPI00_07975 [Flavobacteriales bacterium]|nr:hypothetical protein [Flavobacteriales bacterium]MBK7240103.1 hypothetical protein [Flavobacteriales bacterium]MBP9136857.1 hypothetical protein [Flavobacteriales bacterium]HQV51678.1 hypothetical protein [Flavobacteriales bacterium]HQX29221.1 hypothetical protein [Flavobacteriales bacterium]
MYRTLSPTYNAAYQQHLEAFQRRLARTFPQRTHFTDFYPSIGTRTNEPVDVLVYGQAVGGWHPEWDFTKAVPRGRIEESKRYSNEPFKDHSPLDWVNVLWTNTTLNKCSPEEQAWYTEREKNYRAWSSFFWQATVKLMQVRHGITNEDAWEWNRQLVWSNLYKIAPQNRGEVANPDVDERILQRPECVDLVRMELEELQPKLCVVLTNDTWWSHFRTGLGIKESRPTDSSVERAEQYGDTRIVVVKRLRGLSYKTVVADIVKWSG